MKNKSIAGNLIGWVFGTAVLVAGIINSFWGNDTVFGIFLVLLSLVYFLRVNALLQKIAGITIPKIGLLKVILGLIIIWMVLGVGELFGKMDMMMQDLG